jgi:EmrB/QacA subfamily drug resistance transporter
MADNQAEPGSAQPPRLVLAFLGMATALAIIDATIVNVALPSISRGLHLSLSTGEWVVSGYGVTLATLLISAGRIGDRIGQRRMLISGVAVFSAASLGCALAGDGSVLVISRFAQGAGAAAVLPSVIAIINQNFRGPSLSTAFAVYGATIGTSAALGPLIGSALIDAFGWRSAFLVNLPVAAVVVIGLRATVPRSPVGPKLQADPWGQFLLLASLALLVFGLVESPHIGWATPSAPLSLGPLHWSSGEPVSAGLIALVMSVALMTTFVIAERRRGRNGRPTLVDLSLFAIPSFASGSLAILIVALGEFGILFLLPLDLQVGHSLSPLRAQLIILPTALGTFISAPITGTRKNVAARTWVLFGLALEVIGLLALALALSPSTPDWLLGGPLLIYGTGVGFAISQLTSATLLAVPFPRVGQAAGVSSTARQVGSAIGVAILTAALSASLSSDLPGRLAHTAAALSPAQRSALAAAITSSPAAAPAIIHTLPAAIRVGAHAAATDSLSLGTRVAAVLAALPIAAAWLLSRRLPRERLSQPAQTAAGAAPEPAPTAAG